MRSFVSALSVFAATAMASQLPLELGKEKTNQDLIFKPDASKSALDTKILVLVPGGEVETEYYTKTAQAIQKASNLNLWVVVPAMPQKLCIMICQTPSLCFEMEHKVNKVVEKAVKEGYTGGIAGSSDMFMSGHSLGGTCAATLTQRAFNKGIKYPGLVVMGSYVTDQKVKEWPVPVFTLGAELDGGLGRPGMLNISLNSSDEATIAAGEKLDGEWQARNKPVNIIYGIDHSDFCPGFHVPGDVYPSEKAGEQATEVIAKKFSSFLHLHTVQKTFTVSTALNELQQGVFFTREDLLSAYRLAQEYERNYDSYSKDYSIAGWCGIAQRKIAGLPDDYEKKSGKTLTIDSLYAETSKNFEDSRVTYSVNETKTNVTFNVSGHNQYYSTGVTDLGNQCIKPAHEIGCKMASADRVAQQLGLTEYNNTLTCEDINKEAVKTAEDLLSKTPQGEHIMARYKKSGRPICYKKDFTATGNIGPLFIKETMEIKDKGNCLEVASMRLGPQSLKSHIFPGVHYCKLLSPARVIDYYMTDSLKAISGCLNKDPKQANPTIFTQ